MGLRFVHLALAHMEERDLNELEGMIRGIAIDGRVNADELAGLRRWCDAMRPRLTDAHWDVLGRLEQAVEDGVIDADEREDLLWVCERLRSSKKRFDDTTKDMQVLHGIIAGIASDGVIEEQELRQLRGWLDDASALKGLWPYDELDSLVTSVLEDGRIDEGEHRFLQAFSAQFLERENALLTQPMTIDLLKHGICAVQPEVEFAGKRFVVTGHSPRGSRDELHAEISKRGGVPHPRVTKEVDYVVVADNKNVTWAFSCYGRKIELAMNLRREGARVVLVHESDFWDALADAPILS